MAQFLQKLMQQLADRFITQTLAQSRLFQRAAMRVVKTQENVSKAAKEASDEIRRNTTKISSEAKNKINNNANDAGGFMGELKKELKRDWDAFSKRFDK